MLKVALTHDIDRVKKTYQYFTYFVNNIIKIDIKSAFYQIQSLLIKDNFWGFDDIIEIEKDFKVKSTFFFLNESIPFNLFSINNWKLSLGRYDIYDEKVVDIIKWLDINGWEIGVHGSYNSYKDINLLQKEKHILEEIIGHEIIGVRQHYLNLYEETWCIQNKIGFKFDSSFGFTDNIGFKDNKFTPFAPLNNDFIEFPQIIMDTPFVNCNNRWKILDEIIENTIENDGLLVINWHNNSFNEREYKNLKTFYIKIIEKCMQKNAVFYKLSDYYHSIKKTKI